MQFKYFLLAAAAVLAVNAETKKECITNNNCETDVNCIAKCFNIEAPTAEQVKDATQCIKDCDRQISCYVGCINKFFLKKNDNKFNTNDVDTPIDTGATGNTDGPTDGSGSGSTGGSGSSDNGGNGSTDNGGSGSTDNGGNGSTDGGDDGNGGNGTTDGGNGNGDSGATGATGATGDINGVNGANGANGANGSIPITNGNSTIANNNNVAESGATRTATATVFAALCTFIYYLL